jgi:hypothetical protein
MYSVQSLIMYSKINMLYDRTKHLNIEKQQDGKHKNKDKRRVLSSGGKVMYSCLKLADFLAFSHRMEELSGGTE